MKAIIHKDLYAIVKSDTEEDAFAIIKDKDITLIKKQKDVNEDNVIEIERDYLLITFDAVLPFSMVGFIAKVSNKLANEGIPIFVISSFTTDHILVKKEFKDKAIKCLEKLKFIIQNERGLTN